MSNKSDSPEGGGLIVLALENLDAFFKGGAEELDFADRARDILREFLAKAVETAVQK